MRNFSNDFLYGALDGIWQNILADMLSMAEIQRWDLADLLGIIEDCDIINVDLDNVYSEDVDVIYRLPTTQGVYFPSARTVRGVPTDDVYNDPFAIAETPNELGDFWKDKIRCGNADAFDNLVRWLEERKKMLEEIAEKLMDACDRMQSNSMKKLKPQIKTALNREKRKLNKIINSANAIVQIIEM